MKTLKEYEELIDYRIKLYKDGIEQLKSECHAIEAGTAYPISQYDCVERYGTYYDQNKEEYRYGEYYFEYWTMHRTYETPSIEEWQNQLDKYLAIRNVLDIFEGKKPLREEQTKKGRIKMIKEIIKERKIIKAVESKKGTRYAIQYKDLSTPFYWKDRDYGYIRTHSLEDSEIDELWTVIEYIGKGKYKDLVSGKVFIPAIYENKVFSYYTQEMPGAEKELKALEKRLETYPLGFILDDAHKITNAIAGKMLDDTIPKVELIKRELQYKEKMARTYVKEHIEEQHEDASKYLEAKTKRR